MSECYCGCCDESTITTKEEMDAAFESLEDLSVAIDNQYSTEDVYHSVMRALKRNLEPSRWSKLLRHYRCLMTTNKNTDQRAAIRKIIQRAGFWRGYKIAKATIGNGYFWVYLRLWIEESF